MIRVFAVGISGPLEAYGRGFVRSLLAQGYARLSAVNQLRVFAHVSRWLGKKHLQAKDFTEERALEFLRARRRAGYTCWCSRRGLDRIFQFLRSRGIVPVPKPAISKGAVERLIASYTSYLSQERGLAPSWVLRLAVVARHFFCGFGATRSKLNAVRPEDVRHYFLTACRGYSPASVAAKGSELRALFRFLFVTGITRRNLSEAVPTAIGCRNCAIPGGISAKEVQGLLDSCDRKTAIGRRDYAVLVLMTRFGLRTQEVRALTIDDIDWHHGELTIHGKGSKRDQLPLPKDVGEALSAYLLCRPRVTERRIFLRSRAPHDALQNIGAIAFAASQRAGVDPVWPHRLRRTVATAMLNGGASLQEIAGVLRHTVTQTTAIYAKVDRRALRALVQPWPGVRQ